MTQYAPVALANAFLSQHGSKGQITHLKLQKLVYYTYGWWLSLDEIPLLTEGPQLWKYGPVFASLYKLCRNTGGRPIISVITPSPGRAPIIANEDEKAWGLATWVWNKYGHASAADLSEETHEAGSPWEQEARRLNYQIPYKHTIPDELIRKFFVKQTNA